MFGGPGSAVHRFASLTLHRIRDKRYEPPHRRPSPRRRLRAACRRRRGRPRHSGRRRQRHRGDDRHGGVDRRGLSAHEPCRRRRLLADPRAVGPRACADGRGPRRGQSDARSSIAMPASTRSRRAGRSRRSRCRARWRPGCWRRRRPSAGRQGHARRACRWTCCWAPAIKHAREGYTVTRSQAQLTVDKYAELEKAPGFVKAFLLDGKAPEVGRHAQADRLRRHARASRQCRARTISIAAMSAARSPPTWSASAAR